jgi:hypothetical protein
MFKLPKNDPRDEEFIKRAHEDPNWPEGLDKPCDWDTVPLWRKVWFRIKTPVLAIAWVLFFCGLFIALIEFIDAGEGMDEPYCNPSPQGCYE